MRNLRFTGLILSLLFGVQLNAQTLKPLKCQGDIPFEFVQQKDSTFQDNAEDANIKSKKKGDDAKELRLFTGNPELDELARTGKILFGDTISTYVNVVGKRLLKSFPGLQDEVRFFVTKEPDLSVTFTGEGTILISMGLLAHVENEAQLAFVMAKEIAHYARKHTYKLVNAYDDISEGANDYKDLSKKSRARLMRQYTKELEAEADRLALDLMRIHTSYNIKEALPVLDMFCYADMPFEDIEMRETYFLDEVSYRNLGSCILNEIYVNEDDEHSFLFKSIKYRKRLIERLLRQDTLQDRVNFIESEEAFMHCQKIARFEVCQYLFDKGRYFRALYCSFLLEQIYGESQQQQWFKAYSLYAIAKVGNFYPLKKALENYDAVRGESQRVYYFMRNVNKDVLMYIALYNVWEVQKKYQKDVYVSNLLKDLIKDAQAHNRLSKKKYTIAKEVYADNTTHEPVVETTGMMKRKGGLKIPIYNSLDTIEILTPLFKDPGFNNLLVAVAEAEKQTEEFSKTKVLLYNPLFYYSWEEQYNRKTSLQKQPQFRKALADNFKKHGVEVRLLDVSLLERNDVDVFNDIALLNDWIFEYFRIQEYYFVDEGKARFISSRQRYLKQIKSKYDVNEVTIGAWMLYARKRQDRFATLFGSIVFFPALPLGIYQFCTPASWSRFYLSQISLQTESHLLINERLRKKPASKFWLNRITNKVIGRNFD